MCLINDCRCHRTNCDTPNEQFGSSSQNGTTRRLITPPPPPLENESLNFAARIPHVAKIVHESGPT